MLRFVAMSVGFERWVEGVGDMFEAIVFGCAVDSEEVEAWILAQFGVSCKVCVGSMNHIGDFSTVYGFKWVLVHIGTGFNFSKDDGGGVDGYYVEFEMSFAPVAFGYSPPFGGEFVAGEGFAPFAEFVVLQDYYEL